MQQKIHDIHVCDTITAQVNLVKRKHIFRRRVRNRRESAELTINGSLERHEIRNLNKAFLSVSNRDEVNLAFVCFSGKNGKSLKQQFVVNHVFQKEGGLS